MIDVDVDVGVRADEIADPIDREDFLRSIVVGED